MVNVKHIDFIYTITIFVKSGDGGNGCVHFRHEKFIPKGGPDGGDGGNGGSIIFKCESGLSTLYHLKRNRHYVANNGGEGRECNRHGADAEDIIIPVPVGTIIRNKDTHELLGEVNSNKETLLLLRGGKGGRGNAYFKTSTNRTPRYAQNGEKGQELTLELEQTLLADVGLIGYPNAGKSTFLTTVSASKAKVGEYAFTTLHPQLGVVTWKDNTFTIADLPGIIDGAAKGKGLGLVFLKHMRHVKILAFVIDANDNDCCRKYEKLKSEIEMYDSTLLQRRHVIIISKVDLIDKHKEEDIYNAFITKYNLSPMFISSFTHKGIKETIEFLSSIINV